MGTSLHEYPNCMSMSLKTLLKRDVARNTKFVVRVSKLKSKSLRCFADEMLCSYSVRFCHLRKLIFPYFFIHIIYVKKLLANISNK